VPEMIRRPDFFIVGAPKCGTTSLYTYLREHRNVFMSHPKEPYFFAEDFPNYRKTESLAEYLACFREADDSHLAIGEATAAYMYSLVAIPKIREFNKRAKLMVMLRNPVELVRSLHAHLLYIFDEDECSIEKAWQLQDARRRGQSIPRRCREPRFLQYAAVAKLGAQVEKLLTVFPRDHVKFVVFDDLIDKTQSVYEQVLSFLNVPSDGRTSFPPTNVRRAHRGGWLGRLLLRPPLALQRLVRITRAMVGVRGLGIAGRLRQLNTKMNRRKPLSTRFRQELSDVFRQDVMKLSDLVGRDLSGWVGR